MTIERLSVEAHYIDLFPALPAGLPLKTDFRASCDTWSPKAALTFPTSWSRTAIAPSICCRTNVAGHVELRYATATFWTRPLRFRVLSLRLHGTYNLESEAIDLHGTLKSDAELSRMSSGFKSVLLKPFDVFLQRKHAGAVVAAHLVGTYHL